MGITPKNTIPTPIPSARIRADPPSTVRSRPRGLVFGRPAAGLGSAAESGREAHPPTDGGTPEKPQGLWLKTVQDVAHVNSVPCHLAVWSPVRRPPQVPAPRLTLSDRNRSEGREDREHVPKTYMVDMMYIVSICFDLYVSMYQCISIYINVYYQCISCRRLGWPESNDKQLSCRMYRIMLYTISYVQYILVYIDCCI